MSDLQIEEVIETRDDVDVPDTGDQYCHIDDGSDIRFYCGRLNEDVLCGTGYTCPDYDGEAICPGCGQPTCPTCASMADLDARLVFGPK